MMQREGSRHTEDVVVAGGGVAACCCASLLSRRRVRVWLEGTTRTAAPMLMLSDQTQLLLKDVFPVDGLFEGATRITSRVVAWGQSRQAVTLPHSGLVISEATLLSRLWPTVELQLGDCPNPHIWSVVSTKSALPPISQHEFGSRFAATSSVELSAQAASDCCWVESVASGWLFLIPARARSASLIAVGGSPQVLLAESRLISRQIGELGAPTGSFPASPRIVAPLCGPGWLACGAAAVAFDPIAGEGAGNAIREGILASAVLLALSKGAAEEALLTHYSNRILNGFLRHLQECCRFYAAVPGDWWQSELKLMQQGMEWVRTELSSQPRSLFRLVGFELESIA